MVIEKLIDAQKAINKKIENRQKEMMKERERAIEQELSQLDVEIDKFINQIEPNLLEKVNKGHLIKTRLVPNSLLLKYEEKLLKKLTQFCIDNGLEIEREHYQGMAGGCTDAMIGGRYVDEISYTIQPIGYISEWDDSWMNYEEKKQEDKVSQ